MLHKNCKQQKKEHSKHFDIRKIMKIFRILINVMVK